MKRFLRISILIIVFLLSIMVAYRITPVEKNVLEVPIPGQWEFQSIDTMKYSRDRAREFLSGSLPDDVIDRQMAAIADTGANYVAIATPYDEEFYPVLTKWVQAARAYHLHVWFRGNFSGWEQWFSYRQITPEEHTKLTVDFLKRHSDILQDGDIFSSCPECENGKYPNFGPDVDVVSYQQFLLHEYDEIHKTLAALHKRIAANYFSMNLDVAKKVMDQDTVNHLGNIIVIDHYVYAPAELSQDITALHEQTGAKIVLGEMGVPIPDIHGNMTDEEQAAWIDQAMTDLSNLQELLGVNYWVSVEGTTALWHADGSEKPAVAIVKKYFRRGIVVDNSSSQNE